MSGLIEITNPNPRPVELWLGAELLHILEPRDILQVPFSYDWKAKTKKGAAKIVVRHFSEGPEWETEKDVVHEIGPSSFTSLYIFVPPRAEETD